MTNTKIARLLFALPLQALSVLTRLGGINSKQRSSPTLGMIFRSTQVSKAAVSVSPKGKAPPSRVSPQSPSEGYIHAVLLCAASCQGRHQVYRRPRPRPRDTHPMQMVSIKFGAQKS